MEDSVVLQQDEGDFADRCLPKTYGFYVRSLTGKAPNPEGIDRFDNFIRTEVPIFQFLNDQYYAHERSPKLRLLSVCGDPALMDQVDESIVDYLKSRKRTASLAKLRNQYIILLENALIRHLVPVGPSR
jgi:hypothetical protein